MKEGRGSGRGAAVLQHLLLAGPVLGLLASLNAYKLSVESPSVADVASHHVVREIRSWHGKALGAYYITPREQTVQDCLAFPVACWMILALAGLVVTGYRFDAVARRGGRRRRGLDRDSPRPVCRGDT